MDRLELAIGGVVGAICMVSDQDCGLPGVIVAIKVKRSQSSSGELGETESGMS